MNRLPKERTIYNNYDLWETYPDEDVKEQLMANGYEEDEITDDMISRTRYNMAELDWEDAQYELKKFFRENGNKWTVPR